MAHSVVCISAEDGSEGQEVAGLVAGSLGYRIVDEDIVARAALEAGVDEGVVADVERRKSLLVKLIEQFGATGGAVGMGAAYPMPGYGITSGDPPSDALMGLIRSVIEDMAEKGSAVIVAHAASLALGDRDDVLRVLVTASPETRARRLGESRGLDASAAGAAVRKGDAGRADYLRRFYGVREELPSHYDVVINTDKVAAERAARLIVDAAS
ncbi:MAG TPA: cytidylate kinase-like family protein [Solirubrobacteraceae bacterium]|nr:cytidylate kinase-like family protein [Solirubrobacteraceae bacterium]